MSLKDLVICVYLLCKKSLFYLLLQVQLGFVEWKLLMVDLKTMKRKQLKFMIQYNMKFEMDWFRFWVIVMLNLLKKQIGPNYIGKEDSLKYLH